MQYPVAFNFTFIGMCTLHLCHTRMQPPGGHNPVLYSECMKMPEGVIYWQAKTKARCNSHYRWAVKNNIVGNVGKRLPK